MNIAVGAVLSVGVLTSVLYLIWDHRRGVSTGRVRPLNQIPLSSSRVKSAVIIGLYVLIDLGIVFMAVTSAIEKRWGLAVVSASLVLFGTLGVYVAVRRYGARPPAQEME